MKQGKFETYVIIVFVIAVMVFALTKLLAPHDDSPYGKYREALAYMQRADSFRSHYTESVRYFADGAEQQQLAQDADYDIQYLRKGHKQSAIADNTFNGRSTRSYMRDGYIYTEGEDYRMPYDEDDTPLQMALGVYRDFPAEAIAEQHEERTVEGARLSFRLDGEAYTRYVFGGETQSSYAPDPVCTVQLDLNGCLKSIEGEYILNYTSGGRQMREERRFTVVYSELDQLKKLDFSALNVDDYGDPPNNQEE